jgi:hypothetical protein
VEIAHHQQTGGLPMEEQQMAANTESVAASQTPETANVGTPETTSVPQTDVTQTQVFAHRLKDETSKAEQRARDALIAEMYGESHGIRTYAEYQAATQRQREAEDRQRYQQAGLDPDMLNQFLENHPDIKAARELKRDNTLLEQDRKLESDPNFGELYKQFRDEVHQLAKLAQADYDTAFTLVLRDKLPSLLSGTKTQAEQEAIKKITQNAQTSTGSLSGGDVPHSTSISQMPKTDFNKLVEQVKRGETTSL